MDIRLGDYGTVFEVTILDEDGVVDVSGATLKEFEFYKPDGSSVVETAAFKTDGSDGIVQYTVESGFLDQVGAWSYQVEVELSATQRWHTTVMEFSVGANLG